MFENKVFGSWGFKGHLEAGSSSLPTGASGCKCCSWVRSTIMVSIFGETTLIQKEVLTGKKDPLRKGSRVRSFCLSH